MWIITKDCIGTDSVDAASFNFNDKKFNEQRKAGKVHKFRMLDDDGNIYYYGESNDNESERAFAPLDYFGEPNAGCSIIEYKDEETGKYEML